MLGIHPGNGLAGVGRDYGLPASVALQFHSVLSAGLALKAEEGRGIPAPSVCHIDLADGFQPRCRRPEPGFNNQWNILKSWTWLCYIYKCMYHGAYGL